MLRRQGAVAVILFAVLTPGFALGQQPSTVPTVTPLQQQAPAKDPNDPIEKIKEEGLKNSQLMKTLSYLSDVIGPRLTASPAMKRANEWTKDKLTSWGLQNAHLESWGPFGRGWTLKGFSAQIVEPQAIPLIAYPKAWSPGTNGPITGPVIYLDAKTEADLEKYKGRLNGAIVLMTAPHELKANFNALGDRMDEKTLLELANAPEPSPADFVLPRLTPEQSAVFRFNGRKLRFVTEEGAAVLVDMSRVGDGGTIFVQAATVPQPPTDSPYDPRRIQAWDKSSPKLAPQIVVAGEHYNRLIRMLQQGEKLRMTVDLAVQFHDEDLKGYNTFAEIVGTDLKDQIVMVGGHMDSWHAGTGATDNGAGVAVAMEAVRILQASGLKPRRTIRIALWSGEEEGLLGSRAYVAEHLGWDPARALGSSPVTTDGPHRTTAEYEKLSAYFNLDNGTGKIRGIYLQGNEAVRSLFQNWLAPFRDAGASTLTASNTFGTDHMSFDAIGIPGFQFIQDEIEYETRTHHSNQDVFDRIQEADMKQASTIMAAFIYNTAMLDEKLPRKPMPFAANSR